jgi:hypothetical protein
MLQILLAIKYLIKHSLMQPFMFIKFLILLILTCFGNYISIIRSSLYMHVMSHDCNASHTPLLV